MLNNIRLTRKWALALMAVGVVVAGGLVFFIIRLNSLAGNEKNQHGDAARVDGAHDSQRSPASDGLTLYLDTSEVRATAILAGTRYLATSGGLVALDQNGDVKRRYTTLDGLPDNDLTALASFQGRLFIGTATQGLVGFDGTAFT